MRRLPTLSCAFVCLALSLPACSDDGGGDGESTETHDSHDSHETETSSTSTDTGDGDGDSGDGDSGDGDGDSGDGDGDSGDGDGDSGDGDGDAGDGDGDSGDGDGDGDGDCMPPTEDPSAIGHMCDPVTLPCPDGYVCGENHGIVLTYACRIECTEDCECPESTTCQMMSDKSAMWMECRP